MFALIYGSEPHSQLGNSELINSLGKIEADELILNEFRFGLFGLLDVLTFGCFDESIELQA